MTTLSQAQRDALIETLHARFEQHMQRHPNIAWTDVQARLDANPHKLASLHAMEATGGEPDVVALDNGYAFYDCAPETPAQRRSICYDGKGQASREKKGVFPNGNALDMAAEMGITVLTEAEYRHLQTLGAFDTKTSSWVKTPDEIYALGGAIFMDRRYNHVFVYHNSTNSFYSSRGFRGVLTI